MINKLMIKGFKCFDDVSLEMKPITMLAGQNLWESQALSSRC